MVKNDDRSERESTIASGWMVQGRLEPEGEQRPSELADPRPEMPAGEDRAQLSGFALVLLGLIGGVYLLYTTVWFSWANYYSTVNSAVAEGSGTIGAVLQQLVFWIAPLAPALWFGSALMLNRGRGFTRLVLWLLVGAVVLVPLPMFAGAV